MAQQRSLRKHGSAVEHHAHQVFKNPRLSRLARDIPVSRVTRVIRVVLVSRVARVIRVVLVSRIRVARVIRVIAVSKIMITRFGSISLLSNITLTRCVHFLTPDWIGDKTQKTQIGDKVGTEIKVRLGIKV
jgi:hypothetical protein